MIIVNLIVLLLALFVSIDPVTLSIGKEVTFYKEKFYKFNMDTNGYWMTDYNLGYLRLLQNQDKKIMSFLETDYDILLTNCVDIKLGEKFFSIYTYKEFYPQLYFYRPKGCTNFWESERTIEDLSSKNEIMIFEEDIIGKPEIKEVLQKYNIKIYQSN